MLCFGRDFAIILSKNVRTWVRGITKMNLVRYEAILEIMESQNRIRVKELADRLGCSEMTVRRNLDLLQEKGLIKRSRGFATLVLQYGEERKDKDTDYYEQMQIHALQKQAIAREAFKLLSPGMSVCLDSGTTVQRLVERIPDDFPLSVITPSLPIAMKLSEKPQVQVLMPSGYLHHGNRALLIEDVDGLSRLHADIAFLSCLSFQLPGGTFERSQTMTNTKRALASIAQKKVLLLDSSKWNVSSIFRCIPLEEISIVVTDEGAPAEDIGKARAMGKEVLVAKLLEEEGDDEGGRI